MESYKQRKKTQNAANCRSFPPFLLPQLLMAFLCLLHSFPLPSNPPLLRPWQYFFPFSCSSPKPFSSSPFRPRLGFGCSFAVSFTFPSPPRRSLCLSSPASSIPFYVPSAATPISSSGGGGGGAKHCPQGREEDNKEGGHDLLPLLLVSKPRRRRKAARKRRRGRTNGSEAVLFPPPKEGEEGGGESVIAAVLPPPLPRLAFLASLLPWLLVVGVFGFVGRWCALPPPFPLPTDHTGGEQDGLCGAREIPAGIIARPPPSASSAEAAAGETEGRRTGIA